MAGSMARSRAWSMRVWRRRAVLSAPPPVGQHAPSRPAPLPRAGSHRVRQLRTRRDFAGGGKRRPIGQERPMPAPGSTLSPLSHRLFLTLWIATLAGNFGNAIQSVGAAWLMTAVDGRADRV